MESPSWTELGTTKVREISNSVHIGRLTWYGHILRRVEEFMGKREKKERKTKAEVVG